jgi:hypothetical protein
MSDTQHDDRPRRLTLSQIVEAQIAALAKVSGDHSTVKLSRNAKGDTQIEVSVRSGEGGLETADDAAAKARELYDELARDYPMGGNGA